VTPSKFLPSHLSFESIRKQAKKLARQVAANNPDAVARIHAQLPAPILPLSLRDAQLVLAREYGFAGWQDLRAAVLRQEGEGLEWAAAEAERAIHDNSVERLTQLVREYPALQSWRGDSGESLLGFATGSFGDSGDPYREQMFTRLECAEFLLDAGAIANPAIWEDAIRARAKGALQLLSRKGVLPRRLDVLAALGDDGVRDCLESARTRPGGDAAAVTQAFLCAWSARSSPTCEESRPKRASGRSMDDLLEADFRTGISSVIPRHPLGAKIAHTDVMINSVFDRKSQDLLLLRGQRFPNGSRDCSYFSTAIGIPSAHVTHCYKGSRRICRVRCATMQCPGVANQYIADLQWHRAKLAFTGFNRPHRCLTRHTMSAVRDFNRAVRRRYRDQAKADNQHVWR